MSLIDREYMSEKNDDSKLDDEIRRRMYNDIEETKKIHENEKENMVGLEFTKHL